MESFYIAGASGYTGRAAVRELRRRGLRTRAHIRPGSTSAEDLIPLFLSLGAEVDRSPWQKESIAESLSSFSPSHVMALLGTTKARGREAAERGEVATYETVDRDLSLMLLEACIALPNRPKYVFLSSVGADAPRGNRYLQARYEVEQALQGSPLEWVVARPAMITGADRPTPRPAEHMAGKLTDAMLRGAGMLGLRGIERKYASMDAEELAAGLVRWALEPQAQATVTPVELRRP
jgi:uncharacterized protein YbjT (DUF2867 family)